MTKTRPYPNPNLNPSNKARRCSTLHQQVIGKITMNKLVKINIQSSIYSINIFQKEKLHKYVQFI